MNHSFDIDIAKEYGLNEAIILNNIYFWCEHNRANGLNIHDGDAWTYNTTKAFAELFPYMSERQIYNALKHLENEGLIKTGCYNANPWDRTKWYSVTEKGKCILQKCKMDDVENVKCTSCENVKSYTTDIKQTDIKPDIKQSFFDNEELNQIFLDFIADRKKRGKKMTDKAIELTVKKLKGFRSDSSRIKAITESIANGWIGIFEPAEDSPKKKYDRTANSNFDGLKSGEVDF